MKQAFEDIEGLYRLAFQHFTIPSIQQPMHHANIDHLLLHFLHESPFKFSCIVPPDKHALETIAAVLAFKMCGGQSNVFDRLNNNSRSDTQKHGISCGAVFKKGHGIFRCLTCALDDTCVLCDVCFRASDHEGHNTSFSYSAGGGGFCDCGDKEAWKVDLNCKVHSLADPFIPHSDNYNETELQAIRKTIATVICMITTTLQTSIECTGDPEIASAIQALNEPDQNATFTAMLWNDESHSFDEVISIVKSAINCTTVEAKEVAIEVDIYVQTI